MTIPKEIDSPVNAEASANGGSPPPGASAPPVAPPALSKMVTFVAVGVMVVYIAALWVLFVYRSDKNWDRMVYLLSGFEAIVFVAVGAIFGTTVQRSSVDAANAHAQQARTEARAASKRADAAVTQGASGQALAAGVRSYANARLNSTATAGGAGESRHGAGIRGQDTEPDDPHLRVLKGLA